ncbi:3-oxoacyl-[acyl-carrier-protein] reductase [uncultured Mitsuokella sp.]|uniref:3-oxoacyl-[acyl-carrier-protein] reductase n=1 Tax=uncultured Mitsuokella sp. TaxID=453120 RepID=UPI00267044F1|nr:3-oxoacyl-[acyl-carrier-protein] reductase [uncultured Mitsuokella sp.]
MLLDGKAALVTGASRGIGRAIALRLASEGAKVAINFAGNQKAAEEVKSEIEANGGEAILVQANVADPADVEAMFAKVVEAFGTVDILVNNAGITRDGLLLRMKDEDFEAVIDTNLKGVFYCTKAAAKLMMKKRSGRIVNMSSVVGLIGNAGQTNYAASKAGVLGFSKSAAKELAARGITVNMVAPGFIDTDMTAVLADKVKEAMVKEIPLRRMGRPEDVANAVLFLVSDCSSYITGQVINVDGGMVM